MGGGEGGGGGGRSAHRSKPTLVPLKTQCGTPPYETLEPLKTQCNTLWVARLF